MDDLSNYLEFDVAQVQVNMMKLKLDFQYDMVLESYEHLMDMEVNRILHDALGLLHEFHSFFPTMIFL